jgi:HEAT repeat protein
LRQKITYGQATLADARRAMTDPDPVSLSNTIHAFYAMRMHRGVIHLLNGMWQIDELKYPELSWPLIAEPPARIALASTINRIRIVNTEAYQSYIRAHKNDDHEFNRAQVAVALGFNGDPDDLPYLRAMSDGDNHSVAQSAITGLSVFGGKRARNVLIELAEKHRGSARGDLMTEMLRRAYRWPPKPRPEVAGKARD